MAQISLNQETDTVKQFVLSLPLQKDGGTLELEGRVICKVMPPQNEGETIAIIERGRELVKRARERNQGTPPRDIEHAVRDAVEEVRRRQST